MFLLQKNFQGYFLRLVLIITVLYLALVIPNLFFAEQACTSTSDAHNNAHFKLGLENVSADFLKTVTHGFSYRVGLVTNDAAVDQLGRRNIELLLDKGISLNKVFVPDVDPLTQTLMIKPSSWYSYNNKKIPCTSVYCSHLTQEFNEAAFKTIDVLFFDMQDVGIRSYRHVAILYDALAWASRNKKTMVLFDRPNILGNHIEGAWGASSRVIANKSIPLRYGLTIGELADYFNKNYFADAIDLKVVPMADYNRDLSHQLIGNLTKTINASLDTCIGYSFLGFLSEVAPFDVGISTEKAYQCLLLPEQMKIDRHKWFELRSMLHALGIESSFYHYFNKHKKQEMSGLSLSVADIKKLSTVKTLVTILTFFKNSGVPLHFSSAFDQLIGSTKMREYIQGRIDYNALMTDNNKELKLFFNKALHSFMYQPLPQLIIN